MVVLVFGGVSLRLLRIIRQGGPHQIESQDSRIYFWSSLPTFIFSSVVSEVGLHPLQSATVTRVGNQPWPYLAKSAKSDEQMSNKFGGDEHQPDDCTVELVPFTWDFV